MAEKSSSPEMASLAGRIMQMAGNGGPVYHFEKQLRVAFSLTGGGDDAVLKKVREVLQPYFDAAESLAASVLSQRETDEDA